MHGRLRLEAAADASCRQAPVAPAACSGAPRLAIAGGPHAAAPSLPERRAWGRDMSVAGGSRGAPVWPPRRNADSSVQ